MKEMLTTPPHSRELPTPHLHAPFQGGLPCQQTTTLPEAQLRLGRDEIASPAVAEFLAVKHPIAARVFFVLAAYIAAMFDCLTFEVIQHAHAESYVA